MKDGDEWFSLVLGLRYGEKDLPGTQTERQGT